MMIVGNEIIIVLRRKPSRNLLRWQRPDQAESCADGGSGLNSRHGSRHRNRQRFLKRRRFSAIHRIRLAPTLITRDVRDPAMPPKPRAVIADGGGDPIELTAPMAAATELAPGAP